MTQDPVGTLVRRAQPIAAFGRSLHTRVREFFDTPLAADAPPIEWLQAVLVLVERQVVPAGRGTRVLPGAGLRIRAVVPVERRTAMEAVMATAPDRVRERLAEVRCEVPEGLRVRHEWLDAPDADWPADRLLEVIVETDATGDRSPRPDPSPSVAAVVAPSMTATVLEITVLRGTANLTVARFTETTVGLGRGADPADDHGPARHNHVAFDDDADEINRTVGRAHARVRYDAVTATYRIFDDGSRNGTSILRDGAVLAVGARDPRGVRLRSGDEVRLGRAAVRIALLVPTDDPATS